MMTFRLIRFGAKSKPAYRIVVVDSKKPRETKAKETIGSFNPLKDPVEVTIDLDRAKFWMDKGAKPSPTVRSLIEKVSKTPKLS